MDRLLCSRAGASNKTAEAVTEAGTPPENSDHHRDADVLSRTLAQLERDVDKTGPPQRSSRNGNKCEN